MPYVDTHAHIFLRSLPMVAGRRYTPGYDVTAEQYLAQLSAQDVGYGVLVQPSFLGTDNTYMLDALDRYPDRLRGIAVVDPAISDQELERMDRLGVVGIRFNTIGRDLAEIETPTVTNLLQRLHRLGWQVEVQARAEALPRVFRAFEQFRGPLVIDHFGLPDPLLGVSDPGFRALLKQMANGRTYVKMSAGYRCHGMDVAALAGALLAVVGPRQLLWGSDWPFTQFETNRSYEGMMAELRRFAPDRTTRDAMDATAIGLFRFG